MSNKGVHHSDNEAIQINQLREILLKEDRSTLMGMQQILNDKSLLSEKINPIIEEHLEYLRLNFPDEYSKVVERIIEKKLKDSQEEIIQIIYPKLGQMITRFIQLQFQLLKDNIDNQIRQTFNRFYFFTRLKNKIFGIKDADVLTASLDAVSLEEIFLIQRPSGLLMGSAALHPSVDRDVVAGMLTAIKSFSEDAFERDNEELEQIQYGTYRILLHTFPNYYFALALNGSVSTKEGEDLRNELMAFVEKSDKLIVEDITDDYQNEISQALENQFIVNQRNKIQTLRIKQ